ncbi:MAG: glycosyltransferase family 4 protein [Lachnospiraceae bacterium]|nr:glycosyltransferase family 4 protein [Lachnospiraceae bacterium]
MEKQIHIAMLIGSLTKGGAERVLVNLADYFAGKGYLVTMVTQYQKEDEYPLNEKVKRVISDITKEETTGSRIINFVRRFRKLRNIWKSEKPDLILSFIGKNNMMAILTSRFLNIPVAVSVRAEPAMEYYNAWMRFMARHLFAKTAGVILQTRQCFAFFPKKVRDKAVILKNPVSSSFFRERYEGEREKTIVAVGRIDENKNHEMLIKAFTGIAEEFPEYKLIIYGEGDCREKLMKMAEELGYADRILLPGSIDHVSDAIYKTRVFVLPSNSEGVPNTLIEAMLMGLTVVSTNCPCGGPADLIEDGVNGILIPVGDVELLTEKLQYLINNLQIADVMGAKAMQTADIYQPEKVYGAWEKFLLSICKTQ